MRRCLALAAAAALSFLAASAGAQTLARGAMLGIGMSPDSAGIRIASVAPGGSAEASGLKPGDVITAIGDATGSALQDALKAALKQPQTIAFKVLRDGAETAIPVTLKEKPKEQYDDLDVTYGEVKGPHATHRTIVVKPKGEGPFPAMFYIQGMPCESVDYFAPSPFPIRDFLAGIARRGYVVYRMEKSGVGDSNGAPCMDQNYPDETAGYVAGLEDLKKLPYVDLNRVFLFGHSMGGFQAPQLAADDGVAGVVVYGTGSLTWTEYWDANLRRQSSMWTDDPVTEDQVVRRAQLFNANVIVNGMSPKEFFAKFPEMDAAREELGMQDEDHYAHRHYTFWQTLYRNEPFTNLRDAKTRFLALWGEADFVSARAEHETFARVANHYHPGTAEFQVVPQTDHVFFRKASEAEAKADAFKGEFNPAIIGVVADWMDRTGGKGGA